MTEFRIGDRVLLKDVGDMKGWEGLEAVIISQPGEQTRVRLKDGLRRPDGHQPFDFVWTDCVLITPDNDPALLQFRERVNELTSRAIKAENELGQFKETVTEVAVRYAVEHDWCSVVGQALEEMGLSGTVSRTFKVSGTVEVEVPICGDPDITINSLVVNGENVDTYYVELELDD